jgi:hypothetical protein
MIAVELVRLPDCGWACAVVAQARRISGHFFPFTYYSPFLPLSVIPDLHLTGHRAPTGIEPVSPVGLWLMAAAI